MADAGREFAEVWGETLRSNRHLRWVTVGLGIVVLGLLFLAVQLAWQPAPKPIVIRVDEVGRAEALAYEAVEARADPLDSTTKYFLNRFIEDHYSRRRATVQDQWTRSLRFLATDLANATFEQTKEAIALAAAGGGSEVQVQGILLRIQAMPEPPHTAVADFDLVTLEREREVQRQRWSASLRFVFVPEIPLDLVVHNPMGIVITYLKADRALESPQ